MSRHYATGAVQRGGLSRELEEPAEATPCYARRARVKGGDDGQGQGCSKT